VTKFLNRAALIDCLRLVLNVDLSLTAILRCNIYSVQPLLPGINTGLCYDPSLGRKLDAINYFILQNHVVYKNRRFEILMGLLGCVIAFFNWFEI